MFVGDGHNIDLSGFLCSSFRDYAFTHPNAICGYAFTDFTSQLQQPYPDAIDHDSDQWYDLHSDTDQQTYHSVMNTTTFPSDTHLPQTCNANYAMNAHSGFDNYLIFNNQGGNPTNFFYKSTEYGKDAQCMIAMMRPGGNGHLGEPSLVSVYGLNVASYFNIYGAYSPSLPADENGWTTGYTIYNNSNANPGTTTYFPGEWGLMIFQVKYEQYGAYGMTQTGEFHFKSPNSNGWCTSTGTYQIAGDAYYDYSPSVINRGNRYFRFGRWGWWGDMVILDSFLSEAERDTFYTKFENNLVYI